MLFRVKSLLSMAIATLLTAACASNQSIPSADGDFIFDEKAGIRLAGGDRLISDCDFLFPASYIDRPNITVACIETQNSIDTTYNAYANPLFDLGYRVFSFGTDEGTLYCKDDDLLVFSVVSMFFKDGPLYDDRRTKSQHTEKSMKQRNSYDRWKEMKRSDTVLGLVLEHSNCPEFVKAKTISVRDVTLELEESDWVVENCGRLLPYTILLEPDEAENLACIMVELDDFGRRYTALKQQLAQSGGDFEAPNVQDFTRGFRRQDGCYAIIGHFPLFKRPVYLPPDQDPTEKISLNDFERHIIGLIYQEGGC